MLVKLESSIPFKTHTLSRKELTSLVDSYLSKDAEFRSSLTTPPVNYTRLCQTTLACVKLICERLGFFEPVCISEAVYNLKRVCNYAQDRDSLSANIAVDVSSSYHNVILQIILATLHYISYHQPHLPMSLLGSHPFCLSSDKND